jgi:hypothetical protein
MRRDRPRFALCREAVSAGALAAALAGLALGPAPVYWGDVAVAAGMRVK